MPDGLSLIWPWNPGAIILLLVLCLLYLLGLRRVRLHYPQGETVKMRQIVCFFSAIVIAALVLLTPIDTIGSTQLFVVHMFQLVVLTTLCTPLLIFGCPEALLQPLVALPVVRNVVRIFTQPLVASILFNATFLLWHSPRFYDATIGNASLYHAQVLTIFVLSWLNWWPLIGSVKQLRHMSYPLQMLYAFFDGQPVDIFAFILVFSGVAIYSHYAIPPQLGLSAFADQAAGGALLLTPGLVDLVVMSPLFFRWLGQIEQRTRLADEHRQEEEIELVHLEKQEL
ncbi:MAG TPA: cytochrome c oxidase assembly protein [Ktedonosporobacter sp.]|nr:cytochrome c oxidase assembly protein [Ktedonosporobacter sp.]